MGDEVPVLPPSSLAPPRQIRAAQDPQFPQSCEALYPLRQGFDARAIAGLQNFKGGEAMHGLGKVYQPRQLTNLQCA